MIKMLTQLQKSWRTALLIPCLVAGALLFTACSSREQRAQAYYESGMSFLKKNEYAKARLELRNALQLKGDLIEAWRALAQVDEHDRNMQALAEDLRRIAELDAKDVDTRTKLARLYLMSGAVSESLKLANAAQEIDPNNSTILALKAALLFRLKDPSGAVREANKALSLDPRNTDALVILAAERFMVGDPDEALRTLEHVTDDHKDNLGVVALKINIYERKGDTAQAETLLRQLVARNPNESAFRTQLIRFYLIHQRPQDAENELRAVVAKNPDDSTAGLQLASLLGSVKGVSAARAELMARIKAGGQVFPYQLALAKLDFAQGDVSGSTTLLQDLIKTTAKPDDQMLARVTLAQMYIGKNNVAAAEPLINEILNIDNRNNEGLRLRAAIRVDRSQFDDAIADLRRALNDQPRSPALLASLALAYERSGAIELADKAFLDATRAANFDPTFGMNYVAFLERRGLSEQAENVLVQLAGRNPNNVSVLSALARIKLARQDWVGAHQAADAIRNINSKSEVAEQIHAAAFGGQQKFNDSLTILRDAYDAKPNDVQPMAALVDGYLKAKQTDNAQALLQDVLKANPQNAEALTLMGTVQLVKNNPQQAERNFEAAIKAQPSNAVGYRALADLYARQNKIDEALKIVRAGLEHQAKNFQLRFALAGLLEVKRDYELAIAEYEAMLKDQPGSMIVANNLASLLADHRADKASMDRAKSIALLLKNSQIPQFKDTLGWVSYQSGDYETAASLLEDAVSKMPNVALVRYHLGMTYMAAGQGEKAAEQFKKARDLAPNDPDLKVKIDAALKSRSEKEKG